MSKKFSIIFAGTPDFAVPSFKALIDDPDFEVKMVITQPDKPVGRKQVVTPPPVKIVAQENNIDVLQPEDINSQLSIINYQFDYLVVVAYGQILKDEILKAPQIASVNIHASILPRWRGASPIQHSILEGDAETGVTIQMMVEKLDAGDILSQVVTPIDERETAESLHDRLASMGAQLLTETLKNELKPQPQDESQVTMCKKLSRDDGVVDPTTMTAEVIDRHVRALVPWPGVSCTIDDQQVKLIETELIESDDSFTLECAEGSTLYIKKIQSPGRNVVTGREWKQ